jgi:G3E family GTPase
MVTVVDGVNFLLDYQAAESLASRGETLGEEDERSITDLLIEQIEFADVILISKIDLISSHEREELMAIPERLNAQAQIIPMVMGEVPLDKILNTGRFDFERAAQAQAGCRNCAASMCRKPKSTASLPPPIGPAVRFIRSASSTLSTALDQRQTAALQGLFLAGQQAPGCGQLVPGRWPDAPWFAGRWWRFVPKNQWPQDEESVAAIMGNWQLSTGDCRQELVFIGQNIDFAQMRAELDACLLTDEEMALGVEGWRTLPIRLALGMKRRPPDAGPSHSLRALVRQTRGDTGAVRHP